MSLGKKDKGPKKKVKGTHVYSAPGKPVKKKRLTARQRRKRNEEASARKYRERVEAQAARTRAMKENQAAKAAAEAQAAKERKVPDQPRKREEVDGWSPDGGKTWMEYDTGKKLEGFDEEGYKVIQKSPYKMKPSSVAAFKTGGSKSKYKAKKPALFFQGVKGLKR